MDVDDISSSLPSSANVNLETPGELEKSHLCTKSSDKHTIQYDKKLNIQDDCDVLDDFGQSYPHRRKDEFHNDNHSTGLPNDYTTCSSTCITEHSSNDVDQSSPGISSSCGQGGGSTSIKTKSALQSQDHSVSTCKSITRRSIDSSETSEKEVRSTPHKRPKNTISAENRDFVLLPPPPESSPHPAPVPVTALNGTFQSPVLVSRNPSLSHPKVESYRVSTNIPSITPPSSDGSDESDLACETPPGYPLKTIVDAEESSNCASAHRSLDDECLRSNNTTTKPSCILGRFSQCDHQTNPKHRGGALDLVLDTCDHDSTTVSDSTNTDIIYPATPLEGLDHIESPFISPTSPKSHCNSSNNTDSNDCGDDDEDDDGSKDCSSHDGGGGRGGGGGVLDIPSPSPNGGGLSPSSRIIYIPKHHLHDKHAAHNGNMPPILICDEDEDSDDNTSSFDLDTDEPHTSNTHPPLPRIRPAYDSDGEESSSTCPANEASSDQGVYINVDAFQHVADAIDAMPQLPSPCLDRQPSTSPPTDPYKPFHPPMTLHLSPQQREALSALSLTSSDHLDSPALHSPIRPETPSTNLHHITATGVAFSSSLSSTQSLFHCYSHPPEHSPLKPLSHRPATLDNTNPISPTAPTPAPQGNNGTAHASHDPSPLPSTTHPPHATEDKDKESVVLVVVSSYRFGTIDVWRSLTSNITISAMRTLSQLNQPFSYATQPLSRLGELCHVLSKHQFTNASPQHPFSATSPVSGQVYLRYLPLLSNYIDTTARTRITAMINATHALPATEDPSASLITTTTTTTTTTTITKDVSACAIDTAPTEQPQQQSPQPQPQLHSDHQQQPCVSSLEQHTCEPMPTLFSRPLPPIAVYSPFASDLTSHTNSLLSTIQSYVRSLYQEHFDLHTAAIHAASQDDKASTTPSFETFWSNLFGIAPESGSHQALRNIHAAIEMQKEEMGCLRFYHAQQHSDLARLHHEQHLQLARFQQDQRKLVLQQHLVNLISIAPGANGEGHPENSSQQQSELRAAVEMIHSGRGDRMRNLVSAIDNLLLPRPKVDHNELGLGNVLLMLDPFQKDEQPVEVERKPPTPTSKSGNEEALRYLVKSSANCASPVVVDARISTLFTVFFP